MFTYFLSENQIELHICLRNTPFNFVNVWWKLKQRVINKARQIVHYFILNNSYIEHLIKMLFNWTFLSLTATLLSERGKCDILLWQTCKVGSFGHVADSDTLCELGNTQLSSLHWYSAYLLELCHHVLCITTSFSEQQFSVLFEKWFHYSCFFIISNFRQVFSTKVCSTSNFYYWWLSYPNIIF